MSEHKCPDEIVAMFEGDEKSKAEARVEAINWLNRQRVRSGDKVWMPHPQTGVLSSFEAGNDIIVN